MKKLCLLFLCLPTMLSAKVTLPSVFSNGMILQQNTQVKVWGTADSDETVNISPSWEKKTYKVTPDATGHWSVQIPTRQADFKPYSLKIKHDGSTLLLNDILFGEVWLCSGQSNMEMKMRGWFNAPIIGGREAIIDSRNDYIRQFDIEKQVAIKPMENCKGTWKKANPTNVSNMSATAYFFGRQLYRTLNAPVALLTSHWGGATILAFMSETSLRPFPQYVKAIKNINPKRMNNWTPTALFNAMINPIAGYTMKGVIWYQGETDRHIPDTYRKLFTSMLTDWRGLWNIGDFPFIYAQIAPFDYPRETGYAPYMREAQLLSQSENVNAYMVSLTDLGERNNIHPSAKEPVGVRMALRALDKVYKIDGVFSDEPIYKSMSIKGDKVTLSFINAKKSLTSFSQPITAFKIAGEDKVFYPAEAVIHNDKVEVFSKEVPHPVAVRYAFSEYDKGNLYNVEGCCASSFRTDNWLEKDCKYK